MSYRWIILLLLSIFITLFLLHQYRFGKFILHSSISRSFALSYSSYFVVDPTAEQDLRTWRVSWGLCLAGALTFLFTGTAADIYLARTTLEWYDGKLPEYCDPPIFHLPHVTANPANFNMDEYYARGEWQRSPIRNMFRRSGPSPAP